MVTFCLSWSSGIAFTDLPVSFVVLQYTLYQGQPFKNVHYTFNPNVTVTATANHNLYVLYLGVWDGNAGASFSLSFLKFFILFCGTVHITKRTTGQKQIEFLCGPQISVCQGEDKTNEVYRPGSLTPYHFSKWCLPISVGQKIRISSTSVAPAATWEATRTHIRHSSCMD